MNIHVDEVGNTRFAVALELLHEGESFTFDGVNFWLDGDNKLSVGAYTSWMEGNISDERAISDIERGRRLFEYLKDQSNEFAAIVQDRVPEFYLLFDAGTCTGALARLVDGRVEWSKGTNGFRQLDK